MASRPFGVSLIGYLSSATGVVEFIVGLGLLGLVLTSPYLQLGTIFGPFAVLVAILILLAGLFDMSVGYGVLEGKSWGWWVAIVVNIVYLLILVGFASISASLVIVSAIVKTLVAIFYLSTRNVRVFFGIALPDR